MDKILTIIIPTYNMEKYLDKCLTSLIIEDKELMKQFEVLVVIDGAKDRSSEIAHIYQNRYPETFVVIDKENGNYGSCINRGLKEATGWYVKILDADDSFDTVSFSRFLDQIQNLPKDTDVIFSGYHVVNEQDNVTSSYLRNLMPCSYMNWSNVAHSLMGEHHLAMHEVTYRLSLLRDMNYLQTEGISYTDQEWIFYPMTNAKSFYLIDAYVYKYLVGRVGQTMDPKVLQKGVGAHIIIANRMLPYYKKCQNKNNEANNYLRNNLLWLLNHIYSMCLLSNKNGIELDKLIAMDLKIQKEIPELYNCVSNFKTTIVGHFNLLYVKKWHTVNNKYKLPYSILWLIFFKNVIRKLKMI